MEQELHTEFCKERVDDNNEMAIRKMASAELANFVTYLNLWALWLVVSLNCTFWRAVEKTRKDKA
jgi:hypothetical protein